MNLTFLPKGFVRYVDDGGKEIEVCWWTSWLLRLSPKMQAAVASHFGRHVKRWQGNSLFDGQRSP